MKPKGTASDGDSTPCYKTSFEEGCPFNESKTSDEELGRFSSEFIAKTNSFFELHNSFLYDEASGLENYLSDDSFSGVKVNGNYSDKIETVEEENSISSHTDILYSSSKKYGFEEVKVISDLPSAREFSNKTRNTITLEAPLSKNNAINIKFPMSNLSYVPENLAAYRSVRLNKKYRLKKTVRKSRSKKFIVSAKTMERFSSEEILESETPELENATAIRSSSKINYSLDGITKNERQIKSLRRARKDFFENWQDIRKQPENENDVMFDEKEHSEFSSKFQKILKSKLNTRTEKKYENDSTKELNKSKPTRSSKKNKVLSSKTENILNERNDFAIINYKSFILDKQNAFVNKSKSSKYFDIKVEENISKKSKLRVSSRLAKKSAGEPPGNKKGTFRKKSDPQNKANIKIKCNEKNTSKNKAALENYDVLRQNINVEDMDLLRNETESDLAKNEIVATDKKRDVEQQLLQSFPSKESNIDTVNLKSVEAVKESSTKNSHLGRKRPNNDNAEIMPSKKGKRNQVVKRNSEKNVKGKTSSNEDFDEHYITETTKQQLSERVVVSKPSGRSSKRNKKMEEKSTDMTFKLKHSLNDVGTDLCNQKRSKKGKKYTENVNSSTESHSLYSSPNVIQSTFKMNLRPRKYTAVKSADTQNSRKTKTKSVCMLKKTAAVKTEDTLRENSVVKNTSLPILSKKEVVVTADKASEKKTKIYKKKSSNEKSALNNETEKSNVEDTALPVNKIRSGFIKNKIAGEKASETKNKVDKKNSSKKKVALTNYRENSIVEDRALSVKEIKSDLIKNKIAADEKRNEEELLHSSSSKENNIDAIIFKSVDAVKEAKNSTLRKKRSNEGIAEILPSKRRKHNQELVKRNVKCQICSNEDSDEHYIAKTTKKQSAENIEVSKPSVRRSKRSKKMTFKLKDSMKDISSDLCNQETSETTKKHIGIRVSSEKSHFSYNSPHVVQSTSNRPRKYTAVKSADTQNPRKTKNKSDCMSKKTAAVKTGGTLRENNIAEHTSLPIKYIEMDFSKHEIEITTQKTSETKVKVEKKNSPNKQSALDNQRENSIVEDTDLPVREIGNDFTENKIVTSDETSETKNKFDKKKLSKKTAELLSDRENSIVEDTALPAKEIGRDFIKNKIAIANKTFKTKFKVEKKNMSKKKVVLKNEDIFRENNLDEHTYLPANEIVAADKSLDAKIKVKFEKKTVSWENDDILNEKVFAENTDLPVTNNKIGSNVINNKTASGKNRKSKSIHLFKTHKLESQNPSMENTFVCINEKTSGTRMSGISQRNSSIFLQLFDKIAKSSNSETFSKSNPSIAKLVEQRNNSKFATPSTICKELNNKRDEEQLLAEVAPLKKRKQDQEVIQRNSEKIHKGIISSDRDAGEHCNSKTTTEQSAESNKKLEKESNETTYKLINSLKDVSTDLCNQGRTKKEKKYIENLNSSAEYHSSYNSTCDSTLKRNLGTGTCTTVKSANIHSSNKIKSKADSLVISTNPKSLHDDEKVDACSFIKKKDVDSLSNLHEENSKNLKNKKSNNLFFDSCSEDPSAIKTYEMQPNTNKPLHVSQHDKTFDISGGAQPEENASLKLSSDGNITQSKSSSTFVDPNFYNEPKTPRKKKEDKSFSKQEKRIESPKTELINEMSCADTISEDSANEHTVQSGGNGGSCFDAISEESANEHSVQNGSNEGQFCNSSSNGVPMSSLNSGQVRDFLSSYTLYPLSMHCQILYNSELNCYMLATPIQSPISLSAQMPSTSANDNNVSSGLTPQTATSVESTQNVPSLFTNQNVLFKIKPHTTSYTANPQNAFVTRSEELSGISQSNNSVDGTCPMRIRTTETTRLVKVHQARDTLQKPESKLCIDWESVIDRSLQLIDISFIDKLVKQRYGKNLKNCTVREFCSNPEVVHVLSKQVEFYVTECEDPGKLYYNFHDSVLDEPFIRVLKDVVLFFLEHVYEKTQNKYGDALLVFLFSEIYAKFSVLICCIFSNLFPATVQDFTFEKMISFICLTGIIYIFCRCQKNI